MTAQAVHVIETEVEHDLDSTPMSDSTGSSKAPGAFRTISEVAEELDIQQHVLRFWETKFSQVRPLKRGGGRRYYRPEDVLLLKKIRQLLYKDGYTIRGVQKLLKETPKTVLLQAAGYPERPLHKSTARDARMDGYSFSDSRPVKPLELTGDSRIVLQNILNDLKELKRLLPKTL